MPGSGEDMTNSGGGTAKKDSGENTTNSGGGTTEKACIQILN